MSRGEDNQPSGPLPRIIFAAAEDEAKATPRTAALILATLVERLGLAEVARDLGMDKHHGLSMEHILLVYLLFSAYGATSIRDLEQKAQEDTALAELLGDVKTIHQHVLHYFAQRNDIPTLEDWLDRFVRRCQETARFESREDGILALDDSTIEKFGKKMEHIAVVYEHCEKRFCLGYVVVSTCYCDDTKAFPVNFEFRIQTEEEKRRAEEARLKKEAGIDFRRKGALAEWLEVLKGQGKLPSVVSLTGGLATVDNFQEVDARGLPWVAYVSERLPMYNINGRQRWDWDALRCKTLANVPDVSEVEGLKLYTKEVSLPRYDREVDFVMVTDFAGHELNCLLTPRAPHQERVARVLSYLEREEDPESTKLDIGVRLIDRAKAAGIKASTVAVDAWYFVVSFVQAVLAIPGIKRVVSKLKANHQVLYRGAWRRADELWSLPDLAFRHERQQGFKWATLIADMEGLGAVRLVLVQELDKKRPWRIVAQYVLVCTDVKWSALKTIHAYKLRWGIEVFYRTAKQRFAFTEFHSSTFPTIHFHVTCVFLSYLMTAVLRHMTPSLLNATLGEVIDQFLRAIVRVKKRGKDIVVLVGPTFVQLFGLPPGSHAP